MLTPLFVDINPNRTRGGWRMVADVEGARSRSPVRVIAARRLLESWVRGHNSTREVWWHADGHVQDRNSNPAFLRFSKLASVGNEKTFFETWLIEDLLDSTIGACGCRGLVYGTVIFS